MKFGASFDKILSALKVVPPIGGLEIGDTMIRFAYAARGRWETKSMRLPPGIIEEGQVKNHEQCVAAFKAFRRELGKPFNRGPASVIVSLSSASIYSQIFVLPMVEEKSLEHAILLNLRMISPIPFAEAYAGSQVVYRDEAAARFEILSAFVGRSIVDAIGRALSDAGFLVHAVEPKATAVVRAFRKLAQGFDESKPAILLTADQSGVEFVIIHRGQLHFHYARTWRDLQGDRQQISAALLETIILRSLHQVLNFWSSHSSDPLIHVFVAAREIGGTIVEMVNKNFSFRAKELRLGGGGFIGPEWLPALGSGIRGLTPRAEDLDLSLLGISATDEFRRIQLLTFLRFWRTALPIALGILVLVFSAAYVFLMRTNQSLKSLALLSVSSEQAGEIKEFQNRVQEFNQVVTLIEGVMTSHPPAAAIFAEFSDLARTHSILLNRFSFDGSGKPIRVSGEGKSEEQILNFKKTLDANPKFQSVTLPLTEIRAGPDGVVFTMTFSIALLKAN